MISYQNLLENSNRTFFLAYSMETIRLIQLTANPDVKIFYLEGKECTTETKLFKEFATKMSFPDYFGCNWQALDECINDLDWIKENEYLLIVNNAHYILNSPFIILKEQLFSSFIELLENAKLEWENGRNFDDFPTLPTHFNIVFVTRESEGKFLLKLKKVTSFRIVELQSI